MVMEQEENDEANAKALKAKTLGRSSRRRAREFQKSEVEQQARRPAEEMAVGMARAAAEGDRVAQVQQEFLNFQDELEKKKAGREAMEKEESAQHENCGKENTPPSEFEKHELLKEVTPKGNLDRITNSRMDSRPTTAHTTTCRPNGPRASGGERRSGRRSCG